MTDHRRLRVVLACLFALALAVVLGGSGCANGGATSAGGGGDDGSSGGDVTLEGGGETGAEASGCGAGKTLCGATCTDTGHDPKNCGKCGNACPTGQVCSMGMCGYSCSAGETLCGLSEGGAPTVDASGPADTGTPETGGKGDAALPDATAPDAGGGTPDAGGSSGPYCANTNNDPMNCGGCGNACGQGQTCQNGSCVCGQGEKICIASGTCIPTNSCCNSGDCTVGGEICPMPGGMCACPGGEKECSATNSCISSNDCCTTADCKGIMGATCPNPGQACQCTNGNKLCIMQMICVPQSTCCLPTDCSAPNAVTYTCSTTSTMAGTCAVATCTPSCADVDKMYANGCECCDDTSAGHTCSAATQLGSSPLALGAAAATATGVLPTGDSDWYQVTFASENNTAFHGNIQLTAGGGEYLFDVIQGSCSGAPLGCSEGGGATGKTQWEESYNGPSPAGDSTDPTFTPIAPIGTVFIRVYRANPAMATCNPYTLSVQE